MPAARDIVHAYVGSCRAYFNRRGYIAYVRLSSGQLLAEERFYGNDGRKVRADAIRWAHKEAEKQALWHRTAWLGVRASR